ncbi:hypothetical protein IIZ77_01770, partial [Candidatus Saccharibacteria bacterium]|nr:hypothetical protein [Candidatus Saccharibacteria bacterium]
HKTQDPPKIVLMGKNSESVPLRDYKLRICEIARLDASANAPQKTELFDDLRQRSLFEDITTDALNTNPKLAKKYLGNVNVVILDDLNVIKNGINLTHAILKSETFLTHHGRFLFDLAIPKLNPTIPNYSINYVLSTTRKVNEMLKKAGRPSRFLVEDIKLSVNDAAEAILGLRVYLKKEII